MHLYTAILFLTLPCASAAPRATQVYREGTDIAAYRVIQEAGLSPLDRIAAYGAFIANYPRSPLAEVALDSGIGLGGFAENLLSLLPTTDRTWLVAQYRVHHERLMEAWTEGPWITEVEEEGPPAP